MLAMRTSAGQLTAFKHCAALFHDARRLLTSRKRTHGVSFVPKIWFAFYQTELIAVPVPKIGLTGQNQPIRILETKDGSASYMKQ